MKATEFVKKYGGEAAKDFLDLPSYSIDQLLMLQSGLNCKDLKRLVESHELVESLGGLNATKELLIEVSSRDHIYAQKFERPVLEKAIAEVEACQ